MGGRDTRQGDSEPAAGDRGGDPGSRRDPWDDFVERVKERLKGRDRPHIPENDMDVDPHAPAGPVDAADAEATDDLGAGPGYGGALGNTDAGQGYDATGGIRDRWTGGMGIDQRGTAPVDDSGARRPRARAGHLDDHQPGEQDESA